MTYINNLNEMIKRVIKDNSESNLKELISEFKKLNSEIINFLSYNMEELYDTDIFLYGQIIGHFVPISFHKNCYHGDNFAIKSTPMSSDKLDKIMLIIKAYESIYQWSMHVLYKMNDTPMFSKARLKKR
nr:MAG TPA: hypothetical protein [Caudoviricetes sp.]